MNQSTAPPSSDRGGGGRGRGSGRGSGRVAQGRGRGSEPGKVHTGSGVPFGYVPAYLPGSASLVEELNQRVMIVLRDGKHLVGVSSFVICRWICRQVNGTDWHSHQNAYFPMST